MSVSNILEQINLIQFEVADEQVHMYIMIMMGINVMMFQLLHTDNLKLLPFSSPTQYFQLKHKKPEIIIGL